MLIEIQLCEVKSFIFFNLKKKRGKARFNSDHAFLIYPHRHESHHRRKLLAWAVIIVTNDTKKKHIKGDERVSRDAFQNSYDEHVNNSTLFYCRNHYIRCKTEGFSVGIYFH